jgi:hypothetical protein
VSSQVQVIELEQDKDGIVLLQKLDQIGCYFLIAMVVEGGELRKIGAYALGKFFPFRVNSNWPVRIFIMNQCDARGVGLVGRYRKIFL